MTQDRPDNTRPSDADIHALRVEAGAAGDYEMVVICEEALAGNLSAREECERVIAAARAMRDTD